MTSTNGTKMIKSLSTNPPIKIVHLDVIPFAAVSVDLAEYSIVAKPINNQVPAVAKFADGHEETHVFTLDGVMDGDGPLQDFQTLAFPAHWQNVVSVSFTESRIALDNIVVNGLKVANPAKPILPDQLTDFETIAQLPPNMPTDGFYYWEIVTKKGDSILLEEHYSGNPFQAANRYLLVKGNGGVTVFNSTQNPFTGETAVKGGILVGDEDQYEIPTLAIQVPGETPVPLVTGTEIPEITRITQVRPENRKVAFLSEDHGSQENYAVFLANENGILPIVLPDTVLPDGGTLRSVPGDLMLSGGTVAFRSTSSLSSSRPRWFFKFPGQPLRFGLGEGEMGGGGKMLACP